MLMFMLYRIFLWAVLMFILYRIFLSVRFTVTVITALAEYVITPNSASPVRVYVKHIRKHVKDRKRFLGSLKEM